MLNNYLFLLFILFANNKVRIKINNELIMILNLEIYYFISIFYLLRKFYLIFIFNYLIVLF
jgi:hypothetical protein